MKVNKPQGPAATTTSDSKKNDKKQQQAKPAPTAKVSPTTAAPPTQPAPISGKPQQVKPASKIPKRDNSKEKILPPKEEISLKKSSSVSV